VLKINVAVDVPDVEVGANARGRAAQAHFDAANVITVIELQVTDLRRVYTTHEVVVFLLQLADGAR